MAEFRQRVEWGRASSLMALLANCNRASRDAPIAKPSDFDPFAPKVVVPKMRMSEVKALLVKDRKVRRGADSNVQDRPAPRNRPARG